MRVVRAAVGRRVRPRRRRRHAQHHRVTIEPGSGVDVEHHHVAASRVLLDGRHEEGLKRLLRETVWVIAVVIVVEWVVVSLNVSLV